MTTQPTGPQGQREHETWTDRSSGGESWLWRCSCGLASGTYAERVDARMAAYDHELRALPRGQREWEAHRDGYMAGVAMFGDRIHCIGDEPEDDADIVAEEEAAWLSRRAPTQEQPLVPDGMVLVSREEWERVLFNFLISHDSGGCCGSSVSTQEVEKIAAELADAILGTEGAKP